MAKQLTERKSPSKILVHEDLTKFDSVLQTINKTIGLANKVAETYESLNIGPFSQDLYDDLTENGVLNVKVSYRKNTVEEMKRLTNNPSIQNAILGNIDSVINPLEESLQALKKFNGQRIGYFSLLKRSSKASFEHNRFVLTNENIEALKDEYCRVYIEDDKQELAMSALNNLVEAYNKLVESIEPMNPEIANRFAESTLPLSDFLAIKDRKASIYKPALGYFLITI